MELDGFLYLGSVPKVQIAEGTHSSILFPKGLTLIHQVISHRLQILAVVFFPLRVFRNKWEQRVTGNYTKVPGTLTHSQGQACPWQCQPMNALAELFPSTKACTSKAGSGEEQSLAPQLCLGCGSFAFPWGTEQSLFLLCCLGTPLLARGRRSSAIPALPSLSLSPLSFQGIPALLGSWHTRPMTSAIEH